MKLKNNNKKLFIGTASVIIAVIAVIAIIIIATDRQEPIIADELQINDTPAVIEDSVPQDAVPDTTTPTPASTPTPPTTTAPPPVTTAPPETPTNTEDRMLAPVEIPSEEILEILEEHDIQVVAPPPQPTQTAPPASEQRSPDSTTYIDGQLHVWDPILGWIRSSGDGQVTIMDVEDDGRRYDGGW